MKTLKLIAVVALSVLSIACSQDQAVEATPAELALQEYVEAMVTIASTEKGSRAESHLKSCNGTSTDLNYAKSVAGSQQAFSCLMAIESYASRNNEVSFAAVKADFENNYHAIQKEIFGL